MKWILCCSLIYLCQWSFPLAWAGSSSDCSSSKHCTQDYLDYALRHACEDGATDAALGLFEKGGDPYRQKNHKTALSIAARNGMIDFLEEVLLAGPKTYSELEESRKEALDQAFQNAALATDVDTMRMLQGFGVPLNVRFQFDTALSRSLRKGKWESARYLLSKGADPNLGEPLWALARHVADKEEPFESYEDILRELLQKGADPNQRVEGYTPIELLILKHHLPLDGPDVKEFALSLLKSHARVSRILESFSKPHESYSDDPRDPISCQDPDGPDEDWNLNPQSYAGDFRKTYSKEVFRFFWENQEELKASDWALLRLIAKTATATWMPWHYLWLKKHHPHQFTRIPDHGVVLTGLGAFLDLIIEGVPKTIVSSVYYPVKYGRFRGAKKVAHLIAYAADDEFMLIPKWKKESGNWALRFRVIDWSKAQSQFLEFQKDTGFTDPELLKQAILEVTKEGQSQGRFFSRSFLRKRVKAWLRSNHSGYLSDGSEKIGPSFRSKLSKSDGLKKKPRGS